MALTDKLTSIADAIRTKNGTSAKLSLDDMASSILAIESGSGSGNVDVGSYHVWYKNTLPNIIVEEAVGRLYVSGNSVTNKENYGTLVYSDSIEVSNGRVVLVNPTTISNATKGAIDGVIQGKYIEDTNTIYRVPSGSTVGTTSFNTTTRVYVNDLYELSVSGEKGNFIEFVFSKTSNTYPADGEQGDYYYVYKGIVSDEVADPLLQSKTVTPSEEVQTIKPDTDYGGLSQVTVKAISSTYIGSGVTKKSATTYTPGISDQTIASDQYLNGVQTIKGDSNLVAGNIKSGVSIFGVSGSYAGSGGSSGGLVTKSGTTTSATIETGLSSISMFVIYKTAFSSDGLIQGVYTVDTGKMYYVYCSSYSSYIRSCDINFSAECTVDGGTFTVSMSGVRGLSTGTDYQWVAVGEA